MPTKSLDEVLQNMDTVNEQSKAATYCKIGMNVGSVEEILIDMVITNDNYVEGQHEAFRILTEDLGYQEITTLEGKK